MKRGFGISPSPTSEATLERKSAKRTADRGGKNRKTRESLPVGGRMEGFQGR